MRMLLALLLLAVPALAAEPRGCGPLCGDWVLDAGASDPAEAALDAALAQYKEPRARRPSRVFSDDPGAQMAAEMEQSLGPIRDRPQGADLRGELLPLVVPPRTLRIAAQGSDVVLRGDAPGERRLRPGEPHSRVDAQGTARIECQWQSGVLRISERYERRRRSEESYQLRQKDGVLVVTRELRRPGLPALRVRAVYHRAGAAAG